MSKKTPIMQACDYLKDLINEYEERIGSAESTGHQLLANHYKTAKAETAMHLTYLKSLLPTEREFAGEAYREGLSLGIVEVSSKVKHKLELEIDSKPHFTEFYSQFEQKEGEDETKKM